MSCQQTLHTEALKHLSALQRIIDDLKNVGPDALDGDNALRNIAERVGALGERIDRSLGTLPPPRS